MTEEAPPKASADQIHQVQAAAAQGRSLLQELRSQVVQRNLFDDTRQVYIATFDNWTDAIEDAVGTFDQGGQTAAGAAAAKTTLDNAASELRRLADNMPGAPQ
ncbi:MAG TPA: hypothetical protein VLI05_07100 [Candidatus Saccharimonadia bacterium]|nr:hypothetical protein [Candidatus Saccharimonadia bacterium]